MENKLIYTKTFKEGVDGDSISFKEENEIKIKDIEISFNHEGSCCEHVYADTGSMKGYIEELKKIKSLYKIEIKKVEDEGLILFFYPTSYWVTSRIGVFIPCYNSQNGYYSDELEMRIKEGSTTITLDLREAKCIHDDVN